MGIISIEHSDRLLWLGRYTERVYTTLRLFAKSYDSMIDLNHDDYVDFCQKLDIPNIYSSRKDFCTRYCFDKEDTNSIFSNLTRAYDNAIVLREEIGSETLSYIQLAIYDMEKTRNSHAPLIELQKVIDDIVAFWGMVDDYIADKEIRSIIKTGKHIERLSLYGRLHVDSDSIYREIIRLQGRIVQTKLHHNADYFDSMLEHSNSNEFNYANIVYRSEHLII